MELKCQRDLAGSNLRKAPRMRKGLLEKVGFAHGLGKPGRTLEGGGRRSKPRGRWEQKRVFAYSFSEQMLVCQPYATFVLGTAGGAANSAHGETR